MGAPDDSRAPPTVERELANFTTKTGLFDDCITDGELDPDGQCHQAERDPRPNTFSSEWRMPAENEVFQDVEFAAV